MMLPEREIKRMLDGHFYRLVDASTGMKLQVEYVPEDFSPFSSINRKFFTHDEDAENGRRIQRTKIHYTKEEDAFLLAKRREGVPYEIIAKTLQHSKKSLGSRHRLLIEQLKRETK